MIQCPNVEAESELILSSKLAVEELMELTRTRVLTSSHEKPFISWKHIIRIFQYEYCETTIGPLEEYAAANQNTKSREEREVWRNTRADGPGELSVVPDTECNGSTLIQFC